MCIHAPMHSSCLSSPCCKMQPSSNNTPGSAPRIRCDGGVASGEATPAPDRSTNFVLSPPELRGLRKVLLPLAKHATSCATSPRSSNAAILCQRCGMAGRGEGEGHPMRCMLLHVRSQDPLTVRGLLLVSAPCACPGVGQAPALACPAVHFGFEA